MKNMRIGVHIALQNIQMMGAPALIEGIVAADKAGLDTAWLTVGGLAPDPFAVFVGAALSGAERITFGTSIVPTYPRHPLSMVQGAASVDQMAPGRMILGPRAVAQAGDRGHLGHSLREAALTPARVRHDLPSAARAGRGQLRGRDPDRPRAAARRPDTGADDDRRAAPEGLPAERRDHRRRHLLDVAAALHPRCRRARAAGRRRRRRTTEAADGRAHADRPERGPGGDPRRRQASVRFLPAPALLLADAPGRRLRRGPPAATSPTAWPTR